MAMACAAVLVVLAAGCGSAAGKDPVRSSAPSAAASPSTSARATGTPAATARKAAAPRVPLGVYAPGAAGSWTEVTKFAGQVGQPLRYLEYYLGPSDPFPAKVAEQASASGIEMVLQLYPTMSMTDVTAGDDDAYLDSLAAQVADFGAPVILSWAAEANGNWYEYGATRTPAADYRAAWAHVMSRFHGATNVTWMDTLNRVYDGAGVTSDYVVPGVQMYGIDAYYNNVGDTFDSVFGETLRQIRAVSDKPILVAETGIGQLNDQVSTIPGLVQGVQANHLAGLIYFNENQGTTNPYHQNWALTPAGLRALRDSLVSAR
jgi:hypothetical protein